MIIFLEAGELVTDFPISRSSLQHLVSRCPVMASPWEGAHGGLAAAGAGSVSPAPCLNQRDLRCKTLKNLIWVPRIKIPPDPSSVWTVLFPVSVESWDGCKLHPRQGFQVVWEEELVLAVC